jgi:pimeloyl-ACP methyl ester carboxylesterase
MEQWRQSINIRDFYLAGHSFGGYLVGNYAVKYHKYLKKIILISPVGIREKPQNEDCWERFIQKSKEVEKQGGSAPPAYVKICLKLVWKYNISPFLLPKILGQRQTVKIISGYISRRQKTESED